MSDSPRMCDESCMREAVSLEKSCSISSTAEESTGWCLSAKTQNLSACTPHSKGQIHVHNIAVLRGRETSFRCLPRSMFDQAVRDIVVCWLPSAHYDWRRCHARTASGCSARLGVRAADRASSRNRLVRASRVWVLGKVGAKFEYSDAAMRREVSRP